MKKIMFGVVVMALLLAIPMVTASQPETWTLKVCSPHPNDVITTPFMSIKVKTQGYRLDVRYAGTPNIPNIGHYDILIDGQLIDMSGKQKQMISMVGITQGPHVLTLVPAKNDHTEIMESAVDIPFIYTGPFLPQPGPYMFENPPSLMITSPSNGSTVQGGSFSMTVDIQNLVLSAESYGKEMVDGVGHWQIFVDLPPMMNCSCNHSDPGHAEHMMMMMTHLKGFASTDTKQVSLKGLTKNMYHTFTVMLVDNQHMMLMPMVMDMVTVYVAS